MANAYVTRQAVLEEAGLSLRAQLEAPDLGNADGSNRAFVVKHLPLSDSNYDDSIDASDVLAYVNGAAVTVSGIDADTGTITLASAPANGATVVFSYRFQSMPTQLIDDVIEEAQDLIDSTMGSVDAVPYSTVPVTIRKIARVYAAGLLLTRDYGFNANTADTSKDGYKKLELVEGKGEEGKAGYQPGWLDKYLQGGGSGDSVAPTSDSPDVISDPNVFNSYDQATGAYKTGASNMSPDQVFMLGQDLDT